MDQGSVASETELKLMANYPDQSLHSGHRLTLVGRPLANNPTCLE